MTGISSGGIANSPLWRAWVIFAAPPYYSARSPAEGAHERPRTTDMGQACNQPFSWACCSSIMVLPS